MGDETQNAHQLVTDANLNEKGTAVTDHLLSITDLAELLGVPVATVRWWLHQGTGPAYYKLGRHPKFRLSDIDRWLEARRRTGGAA